MSTPVFSSNLVSVDYNPKLRTLTVQFQKSTYEYYNVPLAIFLGLIYSSSKGKYHAQMIKWKYQFKKV